jgi:PPK2 family polyphosphate:nucleotide phosphotransferase
MALAHRVEGGKPFRLTSIDPAASGGLTREEGAARLAELAVELAELEDLLFYAGTHSLLVVLQGRDAAGKDGVTRRILDASNSQSFRVEAFKAPSVEEASHDFLWRVHRRVPSRGEIVVFNRSHYEDVLVVRVHKLAPASVWRKRYAHINHFEALLRDSNTIVLKFFLHISREEQMQRLLARERETEKAWKLNVGDWREREYWDAYTTAYEEALRRCSPAEAPWYVAPADRKWFRDLAIFERIVESLRPYRDAWLGNLKARGRTARAEIEAYRRKAGIILPTDGRGATAE